MKSKENLIYQIFSVLMIVVIVILVVDVIIPRYSRQTPERIIKEIDFSSSQWIEDYVENRVGMFGKDFFLNTAFTYNIRSNKMVVTYASQNSVEEAREYFQSLPGAELTGRNDETSLNITIKDENQTVRIYNYYSAVSRVFELELTLPPELAEQAVNQLELAFPSIDIPELQELIVEEVFGGYVRYRYDRLDEVYDPYTPIFSRGYLFTGAESDFLDLVAAMTSAYPDYIFDEGQGTHTYRINDQILSLSKFVTDAGESVVSLSIQQPASDN